MNLRLIGFLKHVVDDGSFKKSETSETKDTFLVWGYTRSHEIMYQLQSIPIELYQLIYLFLRIYEYFGTVNKNMILNESKTIIRAKNSVNCFGIVDIDSTVPMNYLWKFLIKQLVAYTDYHGFGTGIIDNNYLVLESPIFLRRSMKVNAYGWGKRCVYFKRFSEHTVKVKTGDTVEMELNMTSKVLSLKVNDRKLKISDIKAKDGLKYRMGIYLHGEGNEVELLEYREYSS